MVAFNPVPFDAEYRWHWVASIWRRRHVGEFFNWLTPRARAGGGLIFRQARPGFKAMPKQFVDDVLGPWDAGTGDAILRLYRSADPSVLGAAGADLARLDCPVAIFNGTADPYISARFAARLAVRLPRAELHQLDDAGHWPWIDRPDLIRAATEFLAAG